MIEEEPNRLHSTIAYFVYDALFACMRPSGLHRILPFRLPLV